MEVLLSSQRVPVVYFDNCVEGGQLSIETLAQRLGEYIASLRYDDGTQVPLVDLIGHSMGGLIIRSYLSGKVPLTPDNDPNVVYNPTQNNPPQDLRVRKAIFIGTPHFGACVGCAFGGITPDLQAKQMLPGSQFLWDLATWNQQRDDLRGVDSLAVIGNGGTGGSDDGVVSLLSATSNFAFGVTEERTRIVPYCHTDQRLVSLLCTSSTPIASITSTTSVDHLTWRIVNSFLADTTEWRSIGKTPAQDSFMANNLSVLFTLTDSQGTYYAPGREVNATLRTVDGRLAYSLNPRSGSVAMFVDQLAKAKYNMDLNVLGTHIQLPFDFTMAGLYGTGAVPLRTAPWITGVKSSPAGGPGLAVLAGGPITINGIGLTSPNSTTQVLANGQPLSILSASDQSIQALLPATFQGLVQLTVRSGSGQHTTNVMVSAPKSPEIALSATQLNFAYVLGGNAPAAAPVNVTNAGGGTLSWSASADPYWLSVSPTTGTAPSTISVAVNPVGLAPGSYRGVVRVSAAGISARTISVTLTVTTGAGPTLSVTPVGQLLFSWVVGDSMPPGQVLHLSAVGSAVSFVASASTKSGGPWLVVSPTSGSTPASLTVSINPSSLGAGTYFGSLTITASGTPTSVLATVDVYLNVQALGARPPVVSSVGNTTRLGGVIAPNTWIAIYGNDLTTATKTWTATDFQNGKLPTKIGDVQVTVNGKPAFVYYVSPTQVNVLSPLDDFEGLVRVGISNSAGSSGALVRLQQLAPGFFTVPGFFEVDGVNIRYAAATHLDGSLIGPVNLFPGSSTPAKPGEDMVLYGTGFGPTDPPIPNGQLVTAPSRLSAAPSFRFGDIPAQVRFAGLTAPGLYQFNVTVPESAPDGNLAVVAVVNGQATEDRIYVTVKR